MSLSERLPDVVDRDGMYSVESAVRTVLVDRAVSRECAVHASVAILFPEESSEHGGMSSYKYVRRVAEKP